MKLSDLLKNYREENGISQREFARRCGLSNSLISLMEIGVNPQTGKPMAQDLDTYRKLANGMGISVQKLFEELGDSALVSIGSIPWDNDRPAAEEYVHFMNATVPDNLSVADETILETIHRRPQIKKLVDSAASLSDNDLDMAIRIVEGLNHTNQS